MRVGSTAPRISGSAGPRTRARAKDRADYSSIPSNRLAADLYIRRLPEEKRDIMVVSPIGDPLGEPLYDRRLIKVKDQGLRA